MKQYEKKQNWISKMRIVIEDKVKRSPKAKQETKSQIGNQNGKT